MIVLEIVTVIVYGGKMAKKIHAGEKKYTAKMKRMEKDLAKRKENPKPIKEMTDKQHSAKMKRFKKAGMEVG